MKPLTDSQPPVATDPGADPAAAPGGTEGAIAVEVVLDDAVAAALEEAAASVDAGAGPQVANGAAAHAAAAPEPTPPAPVVDASAIAISELERAKAELFRQLQRTAADFDNYRKRTRRELDDARARGREEILREMLPIVDNLERALAAAGDESSGQGVAEGVRLVLRQLVVALEKFEVRAFATTGELFDPTRHEAISQAETAACPPGTVHAELQKGYLLGERLLRPALVVVARAPSVSTPPAQAPEPEGEQAEDSPDNSTGSEVSAS